MSKARELASLGNAYSDGALSNRNLLINSAMQVAQRGTSFIANSSPYTLDRWKTASLAPFPATQEAVTGLVGFSKCLRIQRPVGMTWTPAVELNQPVESINSVPVAGKTVTLSFWARVGSDYGGGANAFTSSISYHNLTGTDMGMESNDFLATSYSTTVSQANTPSTDWTYYTMTADIASDAYQVGVTIATESWTGTAGANDYFEVTGVQLEVGDTATPFEHRSYGQELALCQRYCWVLRQHHWITGRVESSSSNWIAGGVWYPVEMRASPTYSETGTWAVDWTGTNLSGLTGSYLVYTTTTGGKVQLLNAAINNYDGTAASIGPQTDSYATFDAEL